MKHYRSLAIFSLVALLLVSYNFMSAQWSAPTATAPNGNTPAPVNVGSTTQAKTGNLAVNILAATTEVRSNRYCDALGNNCFTATSTGGLGGGDTITVGGQCFEPAWAVTCNWNWSGDGNDDSTYIVPISVNPVTDGCRSSNRTYRAHWMILAQCAADPVYTWSVGAYSCNAATPAHCQTTTGTNVRTVTCQNQYGQVVADSNCTAPKPATNGTSCYRTSNGSSC